MEQPTSQILASLISVGRGPQVHPVSERSFKLKLLWCALIVLIWSAVQIRNESWSIWHFFFKRLRWRSGKFCSLGDKQSFFVLKGLLDKFRRMSELWLSEEKTNACWLGSLHDSPEHVAVDKVNKWLKIQGIFLRITGKSFRSSILKIVLDPFKTLSMNGRWRNLTLIGRIQII